MKNIYAKQEAILWAEQRGVDAKTARWRFLLFTVHHKKSRFYDLAC
jgi:hypothetical protein